MDYPKPTLMWGVFWANLTNDETNAWNEVAFSSDEHNELRRAKAALEFATRNAVSSDAFSRAVERVSEAERAAYARAKRWHEDLRKETVVRITHEQRERLISILGINSESEDWAVDLAMRLEATRC